MEPSTPVQPDAFYSSQQAAKILLTTERTLEAWRGKGIGPAFVRLGGRLVRYRGKDLLMFADANTFTSTADEAARAA